MVSYHSWAAQLLFSRMADGARTPPEELVNPASAPVPFGTRPEGLSQPAWLNLSPVAWDYPRSAQRQSVDRRRTGSTELLLSFTVQLLKFG